MNVLVLTDVLPAPILQNKKQENDVLLLTAAMHEARYSDVHYTFVYVVTYSNALLAYRSPQWADLNTFRALGHYRCEGRRIEIVAVPNLSMQGLFKSLLIPLGYWLYRRKLKNIIKEKNIQLVHAHNIKSDAGLAYQLFKKYQLPYVVTTRKLGKIAVDGPIKTYLSHARALLNLGILQQKLAEPYHTQRYLMPHGIGEVFLKQQKSYDPSAPVFKIVSLCRLLDWKNIDRVLLALEQVKGEFIYDIYGEGPDQQRLQKVLAPLGIRHRVRFRGYLDYAQVPETLVQYDLFVLPSYQEMFGRVYIEAMACGLPVIGARNCGIDGYIKHGMQGYLVDHRELPQLIAAIQKLLSNRALAIRMGKQAKSYSNQFSWGRIIAKIDSIYRKSLEYERR